MLFPSCELECVPSRVDEKESLSGLTIQYTVLLLLAHVGTGAGWLVGGWL